MEETDILICLNKRNKNLKNIKTIIVRLRSLNLVINIIIFLIT